MSGSALRERAQAGASGATGTLQVSEIYRSLQGESTRAGLPCTLVRLTGCGLRCGYCDTAYAFHGGRRMSCVEVVDAVRGLGTDLVLLTGGEPLEQEGAVELIAALAAVVDTVMVETGGHVDIRPASSAGTIVLDLKTPGSGMESRNLWSNLEHLRATDEVKFVLTDRADYLWARQVLAQRRPGGRRLSDICPVLFSPVVNSLSPEDLAGWILEDSLPVRLNLQLHRILWPTAEGGV